MIALTIYPFYKRISKKKILLVGGHSGELYADNGKALFEYLIVNKKKYDVYWVINKDSKDKKKVKRHVLRGSVRNYLYYLNGVGHFFSHSSSDLAPVIHRYIKPKGIRIHLTHGINGLKKVKYAGKDKTKIKKMADLFLSVSEFEKNIKSKYMGIDKNSILVTGLPRFDNLYNVKKDKEIILYMPTWREWYKDLSKHEFMKTDFFENVSNLLKSNKLNSLLIENDYELHLYVHFYFHQFISTFDFNNDRVKIVDINTDVQKLLINSKILITDYSSVCWDYFYLNRPVLFFQFDQQRYEKERGSYIDLDSGLLGMKSNSLEQLIKNLEYTIKNPDKASKVDEKLKIKYFTYVDNQNCKRVVDSFEEELKKKYYF